MGVRARLHKIARLVRARVECANNIAAAIGARVVAAAAQIQDLAARPCSTLRTCQTISDVLPPTASQHAAKAAA